MLPHGKLNSVYGDEWLQIVSKLSYLACCPYISSKVYLLIIHLLGKSARSRFDQATARGSAHLVNRFSASGKTRQSKASGGQKSKKRSRNSSSTDEQVLHYSQKSR